MNDMKVEMLFSLAHQGMSTITTQLDLNRNRERKFGYDLDNEM